jgi:DNA (cytosine-5)-methyltransferase 1
MYPWTGIALPFLKQIITIIIMTSRLTVIDFFCGAGGFSEGFRQAGFDVIWAVDLWKPAVDTHNENHPEGEAICDDVIRLSNLPDEEFHSIIPDSHVIVGSPPCTFFSTSNRAGKGDKEKGARLIEAYLRIVYRKKYKRNSMLQYWLLENVPKVRDYIRDEYSGFSLGMNSSRILHVKGTFAGEYNAKYFGVPSNRIRYFCGDFPRPEIVIKDDSDLVPLKRILVSLGYPKTRLYDTIHDPIYDISLSGKEITDHHYLQLLSDFETIKSIRLKQDKGYMGRMSIPENTEKPARTIMATLSCSSREGFILAHKDGKLRAPTIREVASLMSFPIDYRFYGNSASAKYRMVGNAVPPKLSYAFAKAILKAKSKRCRNIYKPIVHANKLEFTNLNFTEVSIKKEKEKRMGARFRYHIPYFIHNTYRVELTNAYSDFENQQYRWSAEIHYSQGKKRARMYSPEINDMFLNAQDKKTASGFFDLYDHKISSASEFQNTYCLPTEEIRRKKLVGPHEMLQLARKFIDQHFQFDSNLFHERIGMNSPPYELPKPIAIGYYIVLKWINIMNQKT